jgi:3-methyladenine DNA glycosylase AlkD
MTYEEIITYLTQNGEDKFKKPYLIYGFETIYGLKITDLRVLAKSIGYNPELAVELRKKDAFEPLFLSVLLEDPLLVSQETLEDFIKKSRRSPIVDQALTDLIIKSKHHNLFKAWMNHKDVLFRYGCYATSSTYFRMTPLEQIDVSFGHMLLDQIKTTLLDEDIYIQNAMNNAVVMAGLHVPELVDHAYEIAHHIGHVMPLKAKNSCNIQSATDYLDRYLKEPKYSRVAKLKQTQ